MVPIHNYQGVFYVFLKRLRCCIHALRSSTSYRKKMLTLFELAFTKKELPVKITIKTIVDAHKTEIKEMCELRQKIAAFARRVADLEEEKKRLLQSAQEQEKNLRIGGHQSRK